MQAREFMTKDPVTVSPWDFPEARMLKAVRNFVVERRRLVRQRRRQVIGEANSDSAASHPEVVPQQEGDNSDPLSHPEVPPQLAETQLGEPPAPTVWGKVKWYNALKRYGFVELSDGSGDAFLHASALAGISVDALQPGVTIEFRTAPAQRGLQVTEVIGIDSSTAAPPRPPRKSLRSPSDQQPLEASVQEMGMGLTRFGGHPESLARGAVDAKNTSTIFAGVSPTDGRPRPCWT
jgi:cold shock CspA family protein